MTDSELRAELKKKFGKVQSTGTGYLYVPCPTCHPKDRKKCKRYVYPSREASNCWVCNTTLTLATLLGSTEHVQVERVSEEVEKKVNPMAAVMPCNKVVPLTQLPQTHPALDFLRKDHLLEFERYGREFGIVYCPSDGGKVLNGKPFVSSADRLIFPVNYHNQMVGWQMRAIPGTTYGDREDALRYYHLFNKGSYLYNFDNAVQYPIVIVVEGVKKALKFQNAVATLGKSVSRTQVELLCMNWKKIVLLLDDGKEARAKSAELAQAMKMQGKQVVDINPGDYGYDSPDEMTLDVAQGIVAENIKDWVL